ncbi:VirB4 family type IV secretion/conjugal transfer ATPase [Pasteurella atlantica]|uniref:VirB4 family type IV secretion/conjugal transfer ATPase n=1 Tax=Phocoenobacter atlanticus TaxID=3416742 RepID=UPI0027434A50|nr:VirB4 family type IV secretion/conjugal transfer ATPase [Pasteurella atlantica]MDP8042537.1 VirB4 family type IV secretion/conjugal transfer ATPase [Pasteurella atlantica]
MQNLEKDPLFKALTRPAMFWGVPLIPMFLAFGGCILLAVWTKLHYFILFFFILGVLRLLTSIDEKIFQLYGIKRFLFNSKLKATPYKKAFSGNYYTYNKFEKAGINKKTINNKEKYTMLDLEKAISLEEIIPYSSLLDSGTILTKDGYYIATWEIEGISYETRENESLDRFKNSLNNTIRSFAQENVSIYTHNIRDFSKLKFNQEFDNDFSKEISEKYQSSFKENDFMENSLFVSLILKPSKMIDKINKKTQSKEEKILTIEERLYRFNELSERFEQALAKFGSNKLSSYEKDDVIYSEQLAFYNFLLTGNYQKIRVLNSPIYTYLGNIEMICGKDIAEINYNGKSSFVRGIEIKDWVNGTSAGFLDDLINLGCRSILTQSFSILPKTEARTLIDRQAKQLKSTDDDSISQLDDLEQAKDDLSSGNICFGEHHFTLMLYADSIQEIKKVSNNAVTRINDLGFMATLSNIAFDEAFFSQLPANFKFRPRTSLISSKNFAGLNSLHNNPIGKPSNNCWGNAVSLLKTSSNTPFYFNFHQTKLGRNDFGDMHLGHTLILGKSGTGKTALCSFFLTQCMAYRLPKSFPKNAENKKFTAIYFDKDYGAEINVRALDGDYNHLKNGKSTGFNPFMLDNTQENIDFLNTLMSILATDDGSKLTTREKENLNTAIKSVMGLPKEYRQYGISRLLENIQEDITDDNSLKKRLAIWQKGNIYGWVFDNENDNLSFDLNSVYGFDGTEVLDNKAVIEPLAFYLLHRIQMMLDGRRVILFMDEFWKWLQGAIFSEFIYDLLKTIRKRNGFLVMITQSPQEILDSPVSRTIIEQVETFIYLPNNKADYDQYVGSFRVSSKEFDLIKSFDDDSRKFLIKKGNDGEGDSRGNTVVAKLDLSGIGKANLKILSGSTDNIAIMNNIIKDVGNNSKDWLPIFKEQMEH